MPARSKRIAEEALLIWQRLRHVFPDMAEYAEQAERLQRLLSLGDT